MTNWTFYEVSCSRVTKSPSIYCEPTRNSILYAWCVVWKKNFFHCILSKRVCHSSQKWKWFMRLRSPYLKTTLLIITCHFNRLFVLLQDSSQSRVISWLSWGHWLSIVQYLQHASRIHFVPVSIVFLCLTHSCPPRAIVSARSSSSSSSRGHIARH